MPPDVANEIAPRALFVEALERGELRPAAGQDFGAVADLVLVDESVEPVAVDEEPVGIDGGRGRRVARAAAIVDLARARSVLVAPDDGARRRIERDDAGRPSW